jgi:hypothetical protein
MASETKHTPGPWRVAAMRGFAGSIGVGPKGETAVAVIAADAFPSEREANARLIAAAPELLAALRAMIGVWEHGIDPSDEQEIGEPTAVRWARAAIAKAEGREGE